MKAADGRGEGRKIEWIETKCDRQAYRRYPTQLGIEIGSKKNPTMNETDSFDNPEINRLQMYLYLTPVIGFFPALWTLYRRKGTKGQQAVSKLAVTLAFSWLLGYILLGSGANASESFQLPLLVMNSLFTSGYFVASLWLMVRLSQRRSLPLWKKPPL
jgi:hypothetical protein